MANNIHLIGCYNVRVMPDVENLIAIDCRDMEIDSAYSNTTIFKNGAIVITEDGFGETITITDSTVLDLRYSTYFCDTTSNDIEVTLRDPGRPVTFIKKSGGNDLTLIPESGNIDGGADYTVTSPVTVFFDGANWFVK